MTRGDPFPMEAREKALKLYLGGDSLKVIANILAAEYDRPCKPANISSWSKIGKWSKLKEQTKILAISEIVSKKKNDFVQISEEQAKIYRDVREKANEELQALSFDRPLDAVRALDIGIQGERKISAGIFQVDFLQKIVQIILEEVKDSDAVRRIGIRFQQLITEAKS